MGRGCAILLGGMVAKVELARGMGLTARGHGGRPPAWASWKRGCGGRSGA